MSHTITVELSDEMYALIQDQAQEAGTSPAQWISHQLEEQCQQRLSSSAVDQDAQEKTKQQARERFERHFGEIDLGTPTGVENSAIDDDLAREYDNPHEVG